jgi:hypothetical protein
MPIVKWEGVPDMNVAILRRQAVLLASCLLLAGCSRDIPPTEQRVASSGKVAVELHAVPAEVMQAARTSRPQLDIGSAEHELRDGQDYYDLEGTMPDGTEVELDLTKVNGAWTVVEIQRDIGMKDVPGEVREALARANPDFRPDRIIESDQDDGIIIYEFFGPGPGGEQAKLEVKWESGMAELLLEEWVH